MLEAIESVFWVRINFDKKFLRDIFKRNIYICIYIYIHTYIYIYIYIGNVYFVRFSHHTICFKQLAPQVARATKTRMLADERISDITWLCRRFAISVLEISYTFVFYHELKPLGFIIASIGAFMKHQELLYGIRRPLWLCKHCSEW